LSGIEHVEVGAHFLPDGKYIVINGNQPGRPGRSFLMDLSTGQLRPVTPEGMHAVLPSPDGKLLAGTDPAGIVIFPIAGGDPVRVPGVNAGLDSTQWSADSKALYVYRSGETPLQVLRLDIRTGQLTPVRLLIPQDKTGVVSIFPVVGARDGSQFVYSYYQVLSALDVVSGLN
jgi:Tol biopolymer transport system component